MIRLLLRHASALGLLVASAAACADPIFPVTNQGALARSFALPELGESTVEESGSNEWRASLDWTNEFFEDQTATESMTLDGETQRFALDWRRGIGTGFELNAELPLLITGGGVLDGIIENWHHFFGLPNGGRDQAPRDRYLYQYSRDGHGVLDVDTATAGLGDIELGAGWQAGRGLALRGMVKLPTGDAGKLLGGNAGAALWADYDPFAGSAHWIGFLSAGGSLNATNDVLADQQQHAVAFAGTGVGYRLFQHFLLMGQLYTHTQLYDDSNLKPLRRDALQLAFGGRYEFSARTALNLGCQEDLVTDSSPDFSIHLDVRF